MGFSAICFSHKYLFIRNISRNSEEIVQYHFRGYLISFFIMFISFLRDGRRKDFISISMKVCAEAGYGTRYLWFFTDCLMRPAATNSELLLLLLYCCFTSTVNVYGHVGTVSYPNHTFPGQA